MSNIHPAPKRTLLSMALTATAVVSVSTAEARIFTSAKDGRTVDAEIVGATEASVRLKVGARQVEISLDSLIEADQRYIELWKKEQEKSRTPDIEVSLNEGLNKRRDPGIVSWLRYNADFDFEIRIFNDERDFEVSEAAGTLIVIGKNCEKNRDDYVVMQKATFPITVKPKSEFKWKGPRVEYSYSEDRSYPEGYKYHSYIFQIENAAGKVIYRKVMAPRFNELSEKILPLEERDKFDPDGEPIKDKASSSSTVF